MQPIGRKTNKEQRLSAHADGLDARNGVSGDSFVLPKFMRPVTRHFLRLLKGGFKVSQRSVAVFGICFGLAVGVASFVYSGQQGFISAQMNAFNILNLKHYDISGNSELSDVEAVKILSPKNGETLFGYDVAKAREALRANPWVQDASVAKVYPNKIAVNIQERVAFAVWQEGDELYLIDRDGLKLGKFDGRRDELPVVVGKGAQTSAHTLIQHLQFHPQIASKVKAYVRVGERRWDMVFENGIRVLLPQNGMGVEISRLAMLDQEKAIFERDLEIIDLRLPDRMVLKVSPFVSSQRADVVEAMKKSLKETKEGRSL
ncbi:MAG: cell division protein FtsQ/DivIB [Nitratireductor sp.]